jgi:hypothetical protein
MTSNCIFHLNTCGYSPYVSSSLTRGWVCRLQLLLVLASTVILRSESRLLSQFRDSPKLEGQVPVFISLRQWVPFSFPPTTRRATVKVFYLSLLAALVLLITLCTDPLENPVSNSASTVACVSVAAGTCVHRAISWKRLYALHYLRDLYAGGKCSHILP